MPSRNRAREAAKAAAAPPTTSRNKAGKKTKKKKGRTKTGPQNAEKGRTKRPQTPAAGRHRTGPMLDPSAAENAETRFVQPYEATKTYICPGCNRDIEPGVGHLVAVPPDAPDLRRHWHRGCWTNRHTRF